MEVVFKLKYLPDVDKVELLGASGGSIIKIPCSAGDAELRALFGALVRHAKRSHEASKESAPEAEKPKPGNAKNPNRSTIKETKEKLTNLVDRGVDTGNQIFDALDALLGRK